MATDWEIHGLAFGNCNCDYGCPCQFEADPTQGNCTGNGFFSIEKGHFGEVSLDGLKLGGIYAWPGPIHEGKGKCQIVIDANANEAQRAALLTISRGEEAEPFSNIFSVYAEMCDTLFDPVFAEIDFEMDLDGRRAKVVVHGIGQASGEPIIGVAGNEHRAQICLPGGIEYRVAEMGRGRCDFDGKVPLHLDDGYAQFNEAHLGPNGVIG